MVNQLTMNDLNLQRFCNQLKCKISKGNISKKEFNNLLIVSNICFYIYFNSVIAIVICTYIYLYVLSIFIYRLYIV